MKQFAGHSKAKAGRVLPLALAGAAVALTIPSAGWAVVSLTEATSSANGTSIMAGEIFTPASVDPELAARVARKINDRGIRFTPAGSPMAKRDRTVTVAVRVDSDIAQAISVRAPAETQATLGTKLLSLQATRYNLGIARGYQSFARPVELPTTVRSLSMPDLATFAPAGPTAEDKPSRLQPRIALEGKQVAGRSRNTLDSLSSQTVDLGGAYRVAPNLDVTAGVRLSQERDRIAPLTDTAQDSQAVYVGTQFKF